MHLKQKCKFTQECPIYQGKEKTKEISLQIYKNVFCYRGEKGWAGCKRRTQLIAIESQN